MTSAPPGTTEYDRFGPWVDRVRTREEVPRLYRDHPLDLDAARLVLKVPRDIARRDATPDMDLYDHLLVLDDGGLTVLSRDTTPDRRGRSTGTYAVATVRGAEVVAIHDAVNLLRAALTVHVRSGTTVSFGYNGSARETIAELVEELRALAAGEPTASGSALLAAARPGELSDVVLPDDVALVSDARKVARTRPELRPVAWHPRRRVTRRGAGAAAVVASVGDALRPTTLHGAVLALDSRTLEVVTRHEWFSRGTTPELSGARLVLPLSAIERFETSEHPRYDDVVTVRVVAGEARVELQLPAGSPAAELLAGVGATAR